MGAVAPMEMGLERMVDSEECQSIHERTGMAYVEGKLRGSL